MVAAMNTDQRISLQQNENWGIFLILYGWGLCPPGKRSVLSFIVHKLFESSFTISIRIPIISICKTDYYAFNSKIKVVCTIYS
jgi:hypothetical protein